MYKSYHNIFHYYLKCRRIRSIGFRQSGHGLFADCKAMPHVTQQHWWAEVSCTIAAVLGRDRQTIHSSSSPTLQSKTGSTGKQRVITDLVGTGSTISSWWMQNLHTS